MVRVAVGVARYARVARSCACWGVSVVVLHPWYTVGARRDVARVDQGVVKRGVVKRGGVHACIQLATCTTNPLNTLLFQISILF